MSIKNTLKQMHWDSQVPVPTCRRNRGGTCSLHNFFSTLQGWAKRDPKGLQRASFWVERWSLGCKENRGESLKEDSNLSWGHKKAVDISLSYWRLQELYKFLRLGIVTSSLHEGWDQKPLSELRKYTNSYTHSPDYCKCKKKNPPILR